MRALTPKVMAAVAALAISSTAAYAAPAAPTTEPVQLTDHQMDTVSAGGFGLVFVSCSFGISCNGNGGSYNGNSLGLVNIGTGNLAGASVLSGNVIFLR